MAIPYCAGDTRQVIARKLAAAQLDGFVVTWASTGRKADPERVTWLPRSGTPAKVDVAALREDFEKRFVKGPFTQIQLPVRSEVQGVHTLPGARPTGRGGLISTSS